jgi:hypothetical protein
MEQTMQDARTIREMSGTLRSFACELAAMSNTHAVTIAADDVSTLAGQLHNLAVRIIAEDTIPSNARSVRVSKELTDETSDDLPF